jgi:hypothetical protein
MKPQPTQQPCKTCKYFHEGFCTQLDDDVEPFWTGCVMHKPKEVK